MIQISTTDATVIAVNIVTDSIAKIASFCVQLTIAMRLSHM